MMNNDKYLLTSKQRDFVTNSLSEFKSQASSNMVTKRLSINTIKERKIMQSFILGNESFPGRSSVSLRKRNILQNDIRMKLFKNPLCDENISKNNFYDSNDNSHLPSINIMRYMKNNIVSQNPSSPQSISCVSFSKNNKSIEQKRNYKSLNSTKNNIYKEKISHTSPTTTVHSFKQKQQYLTLNTRNKFTRHQFDYEKKLSCEKHAYTEPVIFKRKTQPYINLKEKLKNPKIVYLHKLYKQLQSNNQKHSPTILMGNYIRDIFEINALQPPSQITIDSFISRTYESTVHKTPSSSFVLPDIFNYKGFCIYGICEGNISNPKAPLISSISRECLSSHLTDPMAYNLRSCNSIKDVLKILTDNNYSLIRNAFTSVRDEFIQVNIDEDIKNALNVMIIIFIDTEIIVCALGSFVKGYWLEYEKDESGKEDLNSNRLVDNCGKELYIERVNYSKRMKFILMGSGLFWEKTELFNIMKIMNSKNKNLNEIIEKIYDYKKVILTKTALRNNTNEGEQQNIFDYGVINKHNLDKHLLYSIILVKF